MVKIFENAKFSKLGVWHVFYDQIWGADNDSGILFWTRRNPDLKKIPKVILEIEMVKNWKLWCLVVSVASPARAARSNSTGQSSHYEQTSLKSSKCIPICCATGFKVNRSCFIGQGIKQTKKTKKFHNSKIRIRKQKWVEWIAPRIPCS